jgi:hypothetical protein
MRTSRFGQLLLVVGGSVGVAAVVGLVLGFQPARLPDALLNVAVYKLTFAAAAGQLAAGANVDRYARHTGEGTLGREEHKPLSGAADAALGEGALADDLSARHTDTKVDVSNSQR